MIAVAPARGFLRGRGRRGRPSRGFRGGRGGQGRSGSFPSSDGDAGLERLIDSLYAGPQSFRGGPAGQESHEVLLTFLEPRNQETKRPCINTSLVIRNLPPMRIQDTIDFLGFIAQSANVCVENLVFAISPNKSELSARCDFQDKQRMMKCLKNLHGRVFRDHHLLVQPLSRLRQVFSAHCIKISNLSTTVTKNTLWKLFENCGEIISIHLYSVTHEAFVNFERSGSVLNAMKLDRAILGTCTKVVNLDKDLSVTITPLYELYVESIQKDLNISHIQYGHGEEKTGYVFFSDAASFTTACNLDGKIWDGQTISVKPRKTIHVLYLVHSLGLKLQQLQSFFTVEFKGSMLMQSNSNKRIKILSFASKIEADDALKASPVLVGNEFVTLYDESEYHKAAKEAEDRKVGDEMDDNRDDSNRSLDTSVHGVSKSPNGVKVPGKQQKVQKKSKYNKKVLDKQKAKKAIAGAVSEGSGLNTVSKQPQQEYDKEEVKKELEELKRKMIQLTEILGVVSKPFDNVNILEKQQSSHTDLKRKRKEPQTIEKAGRKKSKSSS